MTLAPKRRWFQWSLRTLFLVVTVAGLLISVPVFLKKQIEGEHLLAEFDCGRGRSIHIYTDNFCDSREIPRYEVREGDKVVLPAYGIDHCFSCGEFPSAKDFRLVTAEQGDLVAVIQVSIGQVALIHDFKTGKRPEDDREREELSKRLSWPNRR
jgi:hypothetical protein